MTTTAPAPSPGDPDSRRDPREFRYIAAGKLVTDERKQREIDPERVSRIAHEWDWPRVEALTVAPTPRVEFFAVVEGSHRSAAALIFGGPTLLLPCLILPAATEVAQSQIALNIVTSRRPHSAYEQWRLRLAAGHEHEIAATAILDALGLRVGKAPSAVTIGAVATVRSIIHGGSFTPDYGAELLGDTLDLILDAYPTYDAESTTTRWDRWLLLAVSNALHRFPELDRKRFVESMKVRPALQWVNIGKGTGEMRPDVQILTAILEVYNKGKRVRLSA